MERLQVLVNLTKRNRALSLSIPLNYIYIGIAVALGSMFFSGALTRFIIDRFTSRGMLHRLMAENNILNQKLAAYAAAVDSFRQFLAFTEEMDNRLRSAINLNLLPADIRKLGVGGYYPSSPAPEIDELLRRAKFTQQSLLEIERTVNEQKDRLNYLPSIWPVQGWVTSGFGYRQDPFSGRREFHQGMDIVAPRGTPIVATANGRVVYAGWKAGYGKSIEIDHGWGIRTFYAHCHTIKVSEGKQVKRGEIIGTVGATGQATGNHLHYGVMVNGKWVNPANYILSPRRK